MKSSNFFSYEKIEVNGTMIRPIDVTAKLLFPKWEMKEGDKDFTIMRIIIKGIENNNKVTYQYNLLDRFQDNTISMARTTGYTCTAVANLILEEKYSKVGISPPEFLGKHYNYISKYLSERNVNYKIKKTI